MFEIGDEMFNGSFNDIHQKHDVMGIQGPFVTRMQRFVQRIEVNRGEQRSSCVQEMHAISSTPIRTKNVRRGSPLQNQVTAARPSIYSVPLSPDVSPVGKSTALSRNYSPSEKEISNHLDDIVPSTLAQGMESKVKIGIRHTEGNDFKRNVSRRLPMATAIKRSVQYIPLEIVSDDDGSAESRAFIKRTKSCKRPANVKGKASVHFKTNSYRGLSGKYDSIDSGRGGSAAISSGMRTHFSEDKVSNDGSVLEDQQSDSDSGLSHCTDGHHRSLCHEDERLEHHLSVGEVETEEQVPMSPTFSSRGAKGRRVSRIIQRVNNQQYDYKPLEIVSDDEDDCNTSNKWNNNQPKYHQKRAKVSGNVAGKTSRKKPLEPAPHDFVRNYRRLSVTTDKRPFSHKISRQDESGDELLSGTEGVIDSLLRGGDHCEKENRHLENNRRSSIHYNRRNGQCHRADNNQDNQSGSYMSKSKSLSCDESFARDEMHVGRCRGKGNVSGSEASGYDGSAMEVDEDDVAEEGGDDVSEDSLHENSGASIANYRAGKFDGRYNNHNNLNTSGFTHQISRVYSIHSSGLINDDSRTRCEESFGSDSHCENLEPGQYSQADNEELEVSGNLSGVQVYRASGQQARNVKRIRNGCVGSCGNRKMDASDYESQDEINMDVSRCTDYEHRSKVQALTQSRNDSYLQQDSFDPESVEHGEAKGYVMTSGGSRLCRPKSEIIRAKHSLQIKGGMRKSRKKMLKSDVPSCVALEQNTPRPRKRGQPASQELDSSPCGRSSGKNTKSSGHKQSKAVVRREKLPVGKKLHPNLVQENAVNNPPARKKVGKVRATKDSPSSGSSETAEFEIPSGKTKRGRAKVAKANGDRAQQKNSKLQSESSETAESGSSSTKRKRGQASGKAAKAASTKKQVQTSDENCESQGETQESGGSASPPKKRRRGRPPKNAKLSVQKKAQESSECHQSKLELPGADDGENAPKKRKCVRAPRKNSKKQKIDPATENLQNGSDDPQGSSSDTEADKSGLPKRRPLFSSDRFPNELSLNQNEALPEESEKQTDPKPKQSPFRDKKKSTESSSDYLRKKVLTMRLGTSAFLNSVIEENELVVTSTPKKSTAESRISSESKVESISDEVFEDKAVNSSQLEKQLSTSGSLEGNLEKNKLNKSQGNLEVNGPTISSSQESDKIHHKKVKTIVEPVQDSSNEGSDTKPGMNCSSAAAELRKTAAASEPLQNLTVDARLQHVPSSMNTSAVGLAASSTGKAGSSRGLVQVVIDGTKKELELFAEYSKIPFRSRQKEPKDKGIHYGAALDVLGLGTGYIHLTPGTEKGLQHPKSYNMVFLILDGQVMVKIHESDLIAKPGDFFAVPKGCKYNLTGIGDKNAVVAYFKSKAV